MKLSIVTLVSLAATLVLAKEVPLKMIDGIKATQISKPSKCVDLVDVGHIVALDYEMKIGGKVFDSTPEDEPLVFLVGTDHAIKGLDVGIRGMCVGEKRRLIVEPKLAYGEKGFRDIPPNSTLEFEVELVNADVPPNVFAEIDTNKDNRISREELAKWLVESESVSSSDVKMAVDSVFAAEDLNKDGFISFDEFSGPKGMIASDSTR